MSDPSRRKISGLFFKACHIGIFTVVGALYLTGLFNFIDFRLHDLQFAANPKDASGEVVLIEIDAASLRELNVWPWPRSLHATLVNRLSAAGARRVAFDVDFSSYSSPGEDQLFAAALAAARGRTILPTMMLPQVGDDGRLEYERTTPIPALAEHAETASVVVLHDEDGRVRTMFPLEPSGSQPAPSLFAALAAPEVMPKEPFHVDFAIRIDTIPKVSYADALFGRVDLDYFRGKDVLIGATAVELGDQIAVPRYGVIAGPELQVLAYESMVQGRMLHKLDPAILALPFLLLALFIGPLFHRCSWLRALLVLGTVWTAVLLLGFLIPVFSRWIVDFSPWLIAPAASYAFSLVMRINQQDLSLMSQSLAIRRKDAFMSRIVEGSFNGILTIDSTGSIETTNRAATKVFRCHSGRLIGRQISEFWPGLTDNGLNSFDVLQARVGQLSLNGTRPDGSTFPTELALIQIDLEDQSSFVAIFSDVTERRSQEEKLRKLALNDTLTGLANRTLLLDRMDQALAGAARSGKQVALLLLDLNRFKEVNDTLGHHVGDKVLRQVGERLKPLVRSMDTIARLGGDEFAVLVPNIDEPAQANAVAARYVQALVTPFQVLEGLRMDLGVSIGIALYPDHATDGGKLLQCADVAMYAAKVGAGDISFYDPDKDNHSIRQLTLTGELRRAIEENHLQLYYQPKIDVASRRMVGAEALARWFHAEHGFISPDEFILHAERTGLIGPLTQWAFETALQQTVHWKQSGFDFAMAVNLSARNLHEEKLPDQISHMIKAYKVAPESLILEMTESAIMIDPDRALQVVTRLADLGVRLAIDDFGTGYSSLAYLKRLPVHELKIDRSFVGKMDQDENDVTIVRSTIDLAHNLGLKVVAEGIEELRHLEMLNEMGCDVGQGYFISKPLSSSDLDNWMAESDWVRPKAIVAAE